MADGESTVSLYDAQLTTQDITPMPLSVLSALQPHFLGPFFAAALARYIPLPFTAGFSSRPAARLGTSRDVILLLCMVAALQVFAFPPFPSSLDLLLVLPLVMASVLLHPSLSIASISGEESLSVSLESQLRDSSGNEH